MAQARRADHDFFAEDTHRQVQHGYSQPSTYPQCCGCGRVEATTPVNVASLDASTTSDRVLGSYSGTTLTLVTTNAEVTGTYNSSSSLVLKRRTVLFEPIPASAIPSALRHPTRIHGTVFFIGKAGAFDATLHTTNGALDILVPKLPAGAALSLNARTNNDVATIILPASLRGSHLAEHEQ